MTNLNASAAIPFILERFLIAAPLVHLAPRLVFARLAHTVCAAQPGFLNAAARLGVSVFNICRSNDFSGATITKKKPMSPILSLRIKSQNC